MSHKAFIALGSNLQDPATQISAAFAALDQLPESQVLSRSSLYRTAPVGYDHQPDFINAAVALMTRLEPLALLRALLALETQFGRERPFPNAPRVLDLDLLLYDDLVMNTPELILPHPRMHERAFVLLPLSEIASELVIPGRGGITGLLDACQDSAPVKIS